MSDEWIVLCWIASGAIALYMTLFVFAAQPVSVRFSRLADMMLLVTAVRAGMILVGFPFEPTVDMSLALIAIGLLVSRRQMDRAWLVRIPAGDVGRRIATGCHRLFLEYEEQADGRFVFTAGGTTSQLRLFAIGKRLQLILLPPSNGHAKVTLLASWLAKQFPGPVPRIKIVFRKDMTDVE